MKKSFGLIIALFLTGCEDKALVNVYDKSILDTPITCMDLRVIPPNKAISNKMHSLYHFDQNCPLHLDISYKNSIVCNSTHNIQAKSIQGFPPSYLNMKLRKGFSLKYSYYIDLSSDVTDKDVEKGFNRIKKDLNIE